MRESVRKIVSWRDLCMRMMACMDLASLHTPDITMQEFMDEMAAMGPLNERQVDLIRSEYLEWTMERWDKEMET